MNIKILQDANMVAGIAQKIYKIIGKPLMYGYNSPSEEEQKLVDSHWQEISRIAAENAAKPEIEGVSLHE